MDLSHRCPAGARSGYLEGPPRRFVRAQERTNKTSSEHVRRDGGERVVDANTTAALHNGSVVRKKGRSRRRRFRRWRRLVYHVESAEATQLRGRLDMSVMSTWTVGWGVFLARRQQPQRVSGRAEGVHAARVPWRHGQDSTAQCRAVPHKHRTVACRCSR